MFRGLLLLLLGAFSSIAVAETPRQLSIYTWPEYFDPALLAEFSQEFNVEIKEVWYSSDDEKDSEFFLHYRNHVDLIVGAGQLFYPYLKAGALAPLPNSLTVPALDPMIASYLPELQGMALPFTWGTLGIAYRRDLVAEPLRSWMDILRPADSLKGKINMLTDSQDMFELARSALRIEPGRVGETGMQAIRELLLEQRPFVHSYDYMDPSPEAGLVTGEVSVAVMYNGDALALQQWNDDIAFIVPEEGSLLWIDYLAINAASSNQQAAEDFLRFFARPDVSARSSEYLYFASPFVAATARVPAKIKNNPLIYPSKTLAGKLVVPKVPDIKFKRFQNSLMQQLVY